MAKITVLIPCYRHKQHLNDAICGLLWQGNSDWNAWIIGDGERIENTWHDHRVTVFNEKHRGKVGQLNNFIPLVTTEYIAFNDADDVSLPHRFNFGFIGNIDLIYGQAREFSGQFSLKNNNLKIRKSGPLNQINQINPVIFSTILIKTKLAQKERFRDTWAGYGEDWLWLAHIYKKHKFKFIKYEQPLIYYRVGSPNFKAPGTKKIKRAILRWRIKKIGY